MADVVIVCVRKDVVAAESLADMFEAVGLDVRDAGVSDDELRASGAAVVVWSDDAAHSPAFMRVAERMIASGKAVFASIAPLMSARVTGLSVFDLARWCGDPNDPLLDALCARVNAMALKARAPRDLAPEQDDLHAYAS